MSPVNELATPLTAPARSEAAYTVNRVTTATPIISAVAAAAVRRGCPEALRPASVPATPRAAASGRVASRIAGPAADGPRATTPKVTASAPSATIPGPLLPGPVSPAATAARPATSSTSPAAVRRRGMSAGSAADSRSASSGATRDARTAGTRLTATVTTIPVSQGHREGAAGDVQPARGQREAGPVEHSLEQLGQAESGRRPDARSQPRPRPAPRPAPPGAPGPGWPRGPAAGRLPGCAGRPRSRTCSRSRTRRRAARSRRR